MFLRRPYLFGIAAIVFLLIAGCERQENTTTASIAHAEADRLTQPDAPILPSLEVTTLDERLVSLSSYVGQPVVLNLWATWCPPCRREMPVFEQAQTEFPEVAFVLLNEGESAQQVLDFLKSEGLTLTDVLLDPSSEAMGILKTGGLPTTFFFNEEGKMVDFHLGEITMPDVKDRITRHFD